MEVQTALEEAGVEFIPADDTKGPGVLLKHKREEGSGRGRYWRAFYKTNPILPNRDRPPAPAATA